MKQPEHTAQADHNHAFFKTVDAAFPDWAGTALFYAALHSVDAYLHKYKGRVDVPGHRERTQAIKDDSYLTQIHDAYRALQDLGWNARYNGFRPTAQALAAPEQRLVALRKKLGV